MKKYPYVKLLLTLFSLTLIGRIFAIDMTFDSNLNEFFPGFEDVYSDLSFHEG